MADEPVEAVDDVKADIDEVIRTVVGKINNIDSRTEKADVTQSVLNNVIAGVELSKLEKAGILSYLVAKRVG